MKKSLLVFAVIVLLIYPAYAEEVGELLLKSTTATYSGFTQKVIPSEDVSAGDVVYITSDTGTGIPKVALADADASNTTGDILLMTETMTSNGVAGALRYGFYRNNSWTWTSPGLNVYVSTTAGDLTETQPAGASDQPQRAGYTISANTILFNPLPVLDCTEQVDVDLGEISVAQGVWGVDDDAINSEHYVADSIDNEHVNWSDIDYLGDEGQRIYNATADAMSDDTYNGEVITGFSAGETLSQWDVVFLAQDGKYDQADANAAGEFPAWGLVTTAATDGLAVDLFIKGIIRNDGWTWNTTGGPLYLSETAGEMTETAPSDSSDCVHLIGRILSDDEVYINIDLQYDVVP